MWLIYLYTYIYILWFLNHEDQHYGEVIRTLILLAIPEFVQKHIQVNNKEDNMTITWGASGIRGSTATLNNHRMHCRIINSPFFGIANPDSKIHGANMGPTWVLSAPDGSHVGHTNLAIRECMYYNRLEIRVIFSCRILCYKNPILSCKIPQYKWSEPEWYKWKTTRKIQQSAIKCRPRA